MVSSSPFQLRATTETSGDLLELISVLKPDASFV
jgi:hypothetical protein